MYKVTLEDGSVFEATNDASLLDSALRQEITLEYSCGTGRCGVCKTRLKKGATAVLQDESGLTDLEKASGLILTCCRAASSDISISAENLRELANIKRRVIPSRIDELTPLTEDVMEVVLRTPPGNSLKFLPGQYIDVIAPGGAKRSYSIANAPSADNKLKLLIKFVAEGVLSQYWFYSAKPNDLLRLDGPLGTFFLRKSQQKTLILLATGTGIAPINAILEQLSSSAESFNYKNIYLYWGGRFESDLYMKPDYLGLPLEYRPVLSRSEGWSGRKGYIQYAVIDDGVDLNESDVYACGSNEMILSSRKLLTENGLNENNFYSDAFVCSGVV